MRFIGGLMRGMVGVIGFVLSIGFLRGQDERSIILDSFRKFNFNSFKEIRECLTNTYELSSLYGIRINDSLSCHLYQVRPKGGYFIAVVVLERERKEYNMFTYQIWEVLVIGCIGDEQYVHFGTMDGSNWVVVAVEELGKEGSERFISDESIRIERAWIFDEVLMRFRELPLQGLYRINDGYYYK